MVAGGPALSAVFRDCRRASGARGRRWGPGPLSPSLTRLQKGLQCPETAEGPPARVVAAGGPALSAVFRDCRRASGARGRRWGPGCLRSVQRLQKCLRRAWSPLGARLSSETAEGPPAWSPGARLVAAGGPALFRDCRRASGARGRRWGPGSLRSVQTPQCPETAEGAAARVVAAGGPALFRDCRRASGARGRRWGPGSLRSVQRLQKGLRRAWSPLGARLSSETAEGRPARVVAAGGPALSAVSRDCRSACGARGRRCPALFRDAEGPPARMVAAGGPALSAVFRDCRRASGARGRRWGPGSLRSVQRLQKGLRRAWSPLGARLSPQCPAQCSETAEGAAARVVAAGGPALAIVICKAMVVTGCESHCHGCGQDVRALCLCTTAIVISIVLVLAGSESQCKWCEKDVCEVCLCTGANVICRTSVCAACESPSAARVVAAGCPALSAVSGAVFRDCRRGCGARGRRWGPGSRHCDLQSNGCDRLRIALSWLRPGCACTVSVPYCHCDFHSIGSCRFGVAV